MEWSLIEEVFYINIYVSRTIVMEVPSEFTEKISFYYYFFNYEKMRRRDSFNT